MLSRRVVLTQLQSYPFSMIVSYSWTFFLIETFYEIIGQKINFVANYILDKYLYMKNFNTYLENLDMNFLRNLCAENGKLYH